VKQKAGDGILKAVKYTFDTQFDQDVSRGPASRAEPKLDAKVVEKLKEEAFVTGVSTGRIQAEAEINSKISLSLDQIARQLHVLENQEFTRRQAAKKDVARLAHLIGKKLAATLIKAHPIGEIETLVAECLTTCQQEPKLVIKLNDALVEPMHERIEAMRLRQHLESQIILIGDADIPLGDGRVEWNDGGAERNSLELGEAIDGIVERYVHSIKLAEENTAESDDLAASGLT
jgi:flagellar assembly protein FliH